MTAECSSILRTLDEVLTERVHVSVISPVVRSRVWSGAAVALAMEAALVGLALLLRMAL